MGNNGVFTGRNRWNVLCLGGYTMAKLKKTNGYVQLMLAVCRQWVLDGKPKAGQQTVLQYASILKQFKSTQVTEWYNQARRA